MRFSTLVAILCVFILGVTALAVNATDPSKVTSVLSVMKVTTNDKGDEVLVSADKAAPGDVLQYKLTITNGEKAAITKLQPILPIPQEVEYLPNTGTPRFFEASLDGTSFAAAPLQRQVKQADGTTKTVDVPFSEYRALRWTVAELAAGASTTVSARVKLLTVTPAG